MERFMNIWYIDVESIDSLWNQISNNIVETTKSQNTEKSLYSKIQAKINGLKMVGIEGESSVNIARSLRVEERAEPQLEWKLRKILENIGDNSVFLRDILVPDSGTKLVFVNGYFALRELYCKKEPEKNILSHYKRIENAKDVVWHFTFLSNYLMPIGFLEKRHSIMSMHYDIHGIDFAKEEFDVDIYADGENVRIGIKHLTNNIEYMRPFRFQILGWIEYTGANNYSIKPVAILR